MILTGCAQHNPVSNDHPAIYTPILSNPVPYTQIFDAKFYCVDGGFGMVNWYFYGKYLITTDQYISAFEINDATFYIQASAK